MAGSGDLFGLGAWAQTNLGLDLFARREATAPWHWLGAILSAGITFAALGTNIGHELTHRTTDRGAMVAGRWLLAITFDAEFSIEHVYGHHRRLATPADPASARRGEHFYSYLLRSVLGQTKSAFELERNRLQTLGHGTWSLHNRYLRGWLMSALIVAAFGLAAGPKGVVIFMLAALAGRSVLEAVNYFEHYGLVRDPDQPVEPRHSWNSNKRLSNVMLFNLARHSHHHAEGDAQFWQLRAYRDAPTLPYGYLTCMLLVFLLPGWYRNRMTPLLLWRPRPTGRAACPRCNWLHRGIERAARPLQTPRTGSGEGQRRAVRLGVRSHAGADDPAGRTGAGTAVAVSMQSRQLHDLSVPPARRRRPCADGHVLRALARATAAAVRARLPVAAEGKCAGASGPDEDYARGGCLQSTCHCCRLSRCASTCRTPTSGSGDRHSSPSRRTKCWPCCARGSTGSRKTS